MKLLAYGRTLAASAALIAGLGSSAMAEDYPKKDIMHIMPWSAGGGTDTVMRTFMNYAEKQLGVGVNTQNVTGAQSGVGTLRLMKSRPDGYTIGTVTWDGAITVPYYKLVPGFDTGALSYLGTVTLHPTAIVVKTEAPWQSLEEFVAAAQAAPGTLKVSNVGTGGVWHLPAIDFADKTGIDVQHVPYPKGSGPQRESLLSGETDAAAISISAAYAGIQAGQFRVLGIMSQERDPRFPDVPTMTELGYDVVWGSFRTIATQAAVDEQQRAALERAFAAVFEDPDFQKAAEETGMGAVWLNGADTAAYIEAAQQKAFALMDQLVAEGVLDKK